MKNEFYLHKQFHGLRIEDGGVTIQGIQVEVPVNEDSVPLLLDKPGCMGYCNKGSLTITTDDHTARFIMPGDWFSVKGAEKVYPGEGQETEAIIFQVEGYDYATAQGEVENAGRLRYIDGCRDTLLHGPMVKGDPCINALYMPNGVHQTMHTHPSVRAGFIIHGGGVFCENENEKIKLESSSIFYLPADSLHKFRSDLSDGDAKMMLVAFHPDSDFGPSDEEHPMKNRTIVDGVSAKDIPGVWTK